MKAAGFFWFSVFFATTALAIAITVGHSQNREPKELGALPHRILWCLMAVQLLLVVAFRTKMDLNLSFRRTESVAWCDGVFWHVMIVGAVVIGFMFGYIDR